MPDWKTPVGRVRLAGMVEGASFLFLMGIAMPLKYMAGQPEFVKYGGWCHGILFIIYCSAIFVAWSGDQLTFKKSVIAFIASLIPFGPFLIDHKLVENGKPSA